MRSEPRKTAAAARRGFTTVELMVAIAILALLLGIIVVGFRNVAGGNQRGQTRTILERMRSMTAVVANSKAGAEKFYQSQIPYVFAQPPGYEPPPPVMPTTVVLQWWEAVRADTESRRGDDLTSGRDESLYRTALVMRALLANPEAKAIFEQLPTERRKLMHFDQAAATEGALKASSGANTLSVQMPLDAWGNPIYFVFDNWQVSTGGSRSALRTTTGGEPTGGLTNLESESQKGYWQTAVPPPVVGTLTFTPTAGYTTNLGTAWRAPDRMPFWASAGPDGRLRTHDDNVYSFEN